MSNGSLRPDQAELLDVAHSVFVDEILPHLSGEIRVHGLMVAKALATALRMMRTPPAASDDVVQLCQDIRRGRRDHDGGDQLRRRLIERTLIRLAITNPRALAAASETLLESGT